MVFSQNSNPTKPLIRYMGRIKSFRHRTQNLTSYPSLGKDWKMVRNKKKLWVFHKSESQLRGREGNFPGQQRVAHQESSLSTLEHEDKEKP